MKPAEKLPRARRSEKGAELVLERLQDEVLVYDERSSKAHCLNRAAAIVWDHCDGKKTISQVVKALAKNDLPATPDVVQLALVQLGDAELLEAPRIARARASRRALLKKIGIVSAAAIALPLVQSIVAPTVAQAASVACGAASQACCAPGTIMGGGSGGECNVGLRCNAGPNTCG